MTVDRAPRSEGRRAVPIRLLLIGSAVALALFVVLSVVGLARLVPRARGLEQRGAELTTVSLAMRELDSSLTGIAQELVGAAREVRHAGPAAAAGRLEHVRVRLRALFDSTFIASGKVFGPISDSARVALARATLAENAAAVALLDAEVRLTVGDGAGALRSVDRAQALQRSAQRHLDVLAHDIVVDLVDRELGYNRASDRALRFMFWWGIIGLVLVGEVAVLAYLRLVRPLGALEHGLAELAAGNFRYRLPARRADELGRLVDHVNGIAELLGARSSEESQRAWNLSERLDQVLDEGADEIYIFDAVTWRFLVTSRAARGNLGYTEAQLAALTPLDLLPEFGRERFATVLDAVRSGVPPRTFLATTQRRADGSTYPVEMTVRYSGAESPPVFHAAVQDVSERLRIEAERDLVFEHAADLMMVGNLASGRVLRVNRSLARFLGVAEDDVAGRPLLQFMHPDDLETARAHVARLGQGVPMSDVALRIRTPSGEHRWVSWNIDPPREGTIYAVGRDITDRRRAEQRQAELQAAVARSAREWRMTFDALDDPVVILNDAGLIVRLNEAARRLAGQPHADLLGRGLEVLEPARLWRRAEELAAQVRCEDEPHTWDLRVHPVSASPEGRVASVIVAHDVTAVVRLQDAARRNEAMAAIGALVAGVAHEVRNPLFSMTATLDALEARRRTSQAGARHIQILRGQLDRLQQLMRELLEYGKPPELAPADVGFDAVARQALEDCAALACEHRVEVALDLPPSLPLLRADRARLAQVYVNLLTNSIHYSPEGSRVVMRARVIRDGGAVWLETFVEDAGRGFPAEDLPRIFEPFFSRRPGGTGLGLALVQRIVEQHGGSVTAGNRREGGAVVTVRLPLARAEVRGATT
jgi:PAS domain S-box-containing protein